MLIKLKHILTFTFLVSSVFIISSCELDFNGSARDGTCTAEEEGSHMCNFDNTNIMVCTCERTGGGELVSKCNRPTFDWMEIEDRTYCPVGEKVCVNGFGGAMCVPNGQQNASACYNADPDGFGGIQPGMEDLPVVRNTCEDNNTALRCDSFWLSPQEENQTPIHPPGLIPGLALKIECKNGQQCVSTPEDAWCE